MPRLARVVASPQGPPRAPAGAFTSGASAGLVALGQVAGQAADAGLSIYDAEQRAKARALSSRALGELQDYSFRLNELEPDYNRHEALYDAKQKEVLEKYRSEIETAGYAELFEEDTRARGDRIGWNVRTNVRERQIDGALASLDEAEVSELDQVTRDPTVLGTSLGKLEIMWDEQERAGSLGQQQRVARREQWKRAATAGASATVRREQTHVRVLEIMGTAKTAAEAQRMADASPEDIAAGVGREVRARWRANRAAARHAEASRTRAEKDDALAALHEGYTLAAQGRLTPEALVGLAPRLGATPAAMGPLLSIVERGGKLDTEKPADPAYYREVVLERATDPGKHLERIIDPAKAGNQLEELVTAQGELAKGRRSTTEGFLSKVGLRVGDSKQNFEGGVFADPWGWSENADPAELGTFYLDAQVARARWVTAHGREPDDVEEWKILDDVTLLFIQQHGGQPVTSGLPVSPVPLDVLEGISPEMQARLRASLNRTGKPATPANIRELYDRGIAAGTIEP